MKVIGMVMKDFHRMREAAKNRALSEMLDRLSRSKPGTWQTRRRKKKA